MKNIILLAGPAQVGKTTTANIIKKKLEEKGITVAIINFSDALKEMCAKVFVPLINYLNETYSAGISHDTWWENKHPVQRILLQIVGTEIVREINSEYWAQCAKSVAFGKEESVVILPDFRFPNEHEAFYFGGGRTRKTTAVEIRGRDTSEVFKGVRGHKSENSLVNFEFDDVIRNSGSIEELEKNIDDFIFKLSSRMNEHLNGASEFVGFSKGFFKFQTDTGVDFFVPSEEMIDFGLGWFSSSRFSKYITQALEAKNGNG